MPARPVGSPATPRVLALDSPRPLPWVEQGSFKEIDEGSIRVPYKISCEGIQKVSVIRVCINIYVQILYIHIYHIYIYVHIYIYITSGSVTDLHLRVL